jgi:hypothetical protein
MKYSGSCTNLTKHTNLKNIRAVSYLFSLSSDSCVASKEKVSTGENKA